MSNRIHTCMRIVAIMAIMAAVAVFGGGVDARGQEKPGDTNANRAAPTQPEGAAPRSLREQQDEIARNYAQMEDLMLKLAAMTAKNDPVRANLLKQAFAQSKEKQVGQQFRELDRALDAARGDVAYGDVLSRQRQLNADLKELLALLQSEDRADKLKSESRRMREYLDRVTKLIKEQSGLADRTQRGEDAKDLAEGQRDVAGRTGKLRDDVKKNEEPDGNAKPAGKTPPAGQPEGDLSKQSPGEAKPGSPKPGAPKSGNAKPEGGESSKSEDEKEPPAAENPTRKRLDEAERKMREAQEKLEQSKRDESLERQKEVLEELKQAQAELEKILRQMRQEEIGRTLEQLEVRFRKMLELQTEVYEGTRKLDGAAVATDRQDLERQAGRLAAKERDIINLCDRALALLRDDGSAAALPEAAAQVREDMQQVTQLLDRGRVDQLTQGIEQEILKSLEEILASLAQAREDRKKKDRDGPMGPPGEPGEPPLVDSLQELKMIRSMQVRINRRTKQLGGDSPAEQATDADVVTALKELATRQQRLVQVTRDIVTGKTE